MILKLLNLSITCLLSILLAGCWYSPVQVVPASRNLPKKAKEEFVRRVEADACRALLLGFIPVQGDNRLQTAMSRAVVDPVNHWLAEMTVETKTIFWILGFTQCTIVTGYPQKIPDDAYEKLPSKTATEQPVKDQPDDSVAEQPAGDRSDESKIEKASQDQSRDSTAEIPAEDQSIK